MKWAKRNNIEPNSDSLIIEKLAEIRGIKDVNDWINPSSKFVHSPYKLMNIDKLVETLVKAIQLGKNIVVVSDIDTDGVCSTGVMYNYISYLTSNVRYIHAQRSEGHGVETVLNQITDEDEVVLIVDSSSNSVAGCKILSEKGKTVLIIDHHLIDLENPYAVIVNCQMGDYPNKSLSGSAMCYKVCQVLDDYLGKDLADNFLDLTAIGLVGDMMDVTDMENRYLIYNGINKIQNLGIQEILNQSKVDFKDGITTTNISFKVAPIIGACSRFDKIELALELVTSSDCSRITELTTDMIKMNEKRKTDQKVLVEDIVRDIDDSNNIIILIQTNIDSGFRGLVATEIVERYSKPVFVLSPLYSKGKIVKYGGSARSVGLIPLKSLCLDSKLFNFAQGHEMAYGLEFKAENLDKIVSYFNEVLDKDDLQKVVEYDLELDINDIDEMDIKEVEKFSKIVGQGFPEPKFLIKGITVEEGFTKKLGNHVRAVMGNNLDTVKINCENNFALMKFRSHEKYGLDIENHFSDNFCTELNVVGSLNINRFYNFGLKQWVVTNQVFLEDYKIVE